MVVILTENDVQTKTPEELQSYIDTMRTAITTDTDDKTEYINNLPQFLSYLQKKVDTNPATALDEVNLSSSYLDKDIEIAKKDLEISKERVATLRNPNATLSYYDSWFPLNRPLKNSSLVIILGIAIFLFMISFFMILTTFGFHLKMSIPWLHTESGLKLFKVFPWYIIVATLIFIIIALIGFLRKA